MRLEYILFSLLLLSSCTGYRMALKDASAYEEAGMHVEAFEQFKALYSNERDVKSHIGMKRTAAVILEKKYAAAYEVFLRGDYPEASNLFASAESFRRECESFRLEPAVSAMYREAVQELDNRLFSMYYAEAEKLLLQGDFEGAQLPIRKMKGLNRTDPRIEYLEVLSEILPAYKEGEKAMELGLFMQAYVAFDRVCRLDAGFKDALSLREQARELATFSIAYVQMHGNAGDEFDRALGASIKQAILALDDPFIQLLERQNLEAILDEQRLGMEAASDPASFAQAGRLAGADYLIAGEIVKFDSRIVSETIREKEGFLGPGKKDPKVRYMEHERNRATSLLYRFQIIDSETGTVHASEVIPFGCDDQVKYTYYNGDSKSLWPGQWNYRLLPSKSDRVFGREEKEELDKLMNAPREFEPEVAVVSRLFAQISSMVASRVQEFRPRR